MISGTDSHSSNGSINLLFSPVRRGSACRQLHPLPTILQTDLTNSDQFKTKKYYKKLALTEEEATTNRELYEEIVGNEFPEEDMVDKAFRDKVEHLIEQLYQSRANSVSFLGQRTGPQILDPQCKLDMGVYSFELWVVMLFEANFCPLEGIHQFLPLLS